VAGEHSGDILGGKLMEALNAGRRGRIRYPASAAGRWPRKASSRSSRWRTWP
jgi:hypothetical protein